MVHILSKSAQNASRYIRLLKKRVVTPRNAALAVDLKRALGLVGVLALAAFLAEILLYLLVVASFRAYLAVTFRVTLIFVVVLAYDAAFTN